MALWTPYSQEVPIDLSRSSIKQEIDSPRHYFLAYSPPSPSHGYSNHRYSASPEEQAVPVYPPYLASYPYPHSTFISPEPVESAWSSPAFQPSRSIIPSPPASPESLLKDPEYQAYERESLLNLEREKGRSLFGNNPRMRRAVQSSRVGDDSYRKQRERNNDAAKKSRDRRKKREVTLSCQVKYLLKKRAELEAMLKNRVCIYCKDVCGC